MSEWLTPRCPGCGWLPGLYLDGELVRCGNDDCDMQYWNRARDVVGQMRGARVEDLTGEQ